MQTTPQPILLHIIHTEHPEKFSFRMLVTLEAKLFFLFFNNDLKGANIEFTYVNSVILYFIQVCPQVKQHSVGLM